MSLRRIITQVVVFLLLGAALNVAVAWGFAVRPIVRTDLYNYQLIDITSAIGHLRLHEHNPYRSGVCGESIEPSQFQDLLPAGSIFRGRPPDISPEEWVAPRSYWHEHATGWPTLALRSIFHEKVDASWSVIRTESFGALNLPGRNIDLPLFPIWPGFAINTLFYAAILWLLFAAPFALRRRRRVRRGLCPACAYPVGGSPVCTECGRTVERRSSGLGTA